MTLDPGDDERFEAMRDDVYSLMSSIDADGMLSWDFVDAVIERVCQFERGEGP